jgi:site-specific recombinase XerD
MGSWKAGQAGVILRQFLTDIGIPKDVVFHTLRACFATHLLASGAEAAKVMAIGGWKDFKTFQIYIRLAGVDTAGATDNLSLVPRFDFSNVVALK